MADIGTTAAMEEAIFQLVPLRDVPPEAVRALLAMTTLVRFDADQVVFKEGDAPTDDAWLLVTGHMSVCVATGERQRVMADVVPGEIVGEVALYARGRARSATVVTTVPSTALRVPRAALVENDDQPAVVALELHLLETMARRIRDTNAILHRVLIEQRDSPAAPAPRLGDLAPTAPPPGAAAERLTLAQRLARWFALAR
ncbi:MAG: cyclic nucleotide-binding domain-containing protein [Pseudomonadota bacterium]|nr:cyclic nucleotide-binding domain-containing protein [Pseudomonadota bacterium]